MCLISRTRLDSVVLKVGMVGDSQIGKTSLMCVSQAPTLGFRLTFLLRRVKYVEGSYDEDYIQTLGPSPCSSPSPRSARLTCSSHPGVNFMEKTVRPSPRTPIDSYIELVHPQISIRNTEITFSIWDLGGQREFVSMLPLVCNDAVAILFMFDLSRKSTLNSIKEWYRQARGFNKVRLHSWIFRLRLSPHRWRDAVV